MNKKKKKYRKKQRSSKPVTATMKIKESLIREGLKQMGSNTPDKFKVTKNNEVKGEPYVL